MNVFNYLHEDAAHIIHGMEALAANYPDHSNWTWDRTFEESKRSIQQIKNHFLKQSLVVNNLKDHVPVDNVLAEAENKRDTINEAIDNLLDLHVNERGFEQGLQALAKRTDTYFHFCDDVLYPELKSHLSRDDMKHVREQLDELILS